MRPIDADALKTALYYDVSKGAYGEFMDGSEVSLTDREILQLIDEQPTIDAEPQWIPCSERLPENGTYIVYAPEYRGGSSRSKERHNGIMFAVFKNGKWSIEHCYYSRPNCVKAWMPLPKPYEVNHE